MNIRKSNLEETMYLLILLFAAFYICNASDTSPRSDNCASFDLCRTGDELFRTCSCDSDCSALATCCRDSNHTREMAPPDSSKYKCQSDRTVTPVYAKRACSDDFVLESSHRWECEEAEIDRGDVMGNVLVTSEKNKTTYWNMACAICNNEKEDDLKKWIIQVTCPSRHGDTKFNQNYIHDNLQFDRDLEEWGLKVEDGFKICNLSFAQPRSVTGKLSYCAPNLVSGCPDGFPDREVAEKCLTYHAERRQKGAEHKYFRNAHCAMCNGVKEEELECVGRSYAPTGRGRGRDKVQVSFDQDWLDREGAEKYKCSRNNSWDPFTGRCRNIPHDLLKELMDSPIPTTNQASRTAFHYYFFVFILSTVVFNKIMFK